MICNLFPGLRDKPMATTNFLLAVIAGELFVLIAFLVARFHANPSTSPNATAAKNRAALAIRSFPLGG